LSAARIAAPSSSNFKALTMKKYILLTLLICVVGINGALAQSRKYVSQFSHLQGYFNPALTGYEGSTIRGFVRNQWVGFDGAPKTYFFSADFDFSDFSGASKNAVEGKNAAGINYLSDQHGPYAETELIINYAARIRLSESTNFRLGFGANINNLRLDGNNLTTEMQNDPLLTEFIGTFASMNNFDFNIGGAVTHEKYYVSYAIHNVNKGSISSGDVFIDGKPRVSIIQAGYRSRISENVSIATNALFMAQSNLPSVFEVNFKTVLKDFIWLGAGHRQGLSNNFQVGVILPKLRFGYAYEMPMVNAYRLPNTTHEFMAMFPIFTKYKKDSEKPLLIW